MKNKLKTKIKDYWYSLGDSTRAIVRIASVLCSIGLFILSCFLWEIVLPILLVLTMISVTCFLTYYTFLMLRDSEADKRRRREEILKQEAYNRRLELEHREGVVDETVI